jgi:hypothetical protein
MGARPIGSHGHYPTKHFAVPAAVAVAARDGLALRKRLGRGGTDVGIARARQLASGSPRVTLRDIVYIRSYLRRHIVDNLGEKNPPSNGWIAWQLWGGWAAKKWAERIYNDALRRGWITRRNPSREAGSDAAFFRDVDAALKSFVADRRAKELLRLNRFAAWDNGGCLALQQALLLFFEDALEVEPTLAEGIDVQPAYIVSPGLTEHAIVWVEREGAPPLAVDSSGVKPGDVSARDWQRRQSEDDRELMTVLFDELPERWFAEWRARIADDDLVASTLIIFTENYMKAQSKQASGTTPRTNPFDRHGMPVAGGREPYLLMRCVNGVIKSKMKAAGRRKASADDVSSAHAICTANLQRQGLMHAHHHELTKKGARENDRIYNEERGSIAEQRIREYEGHLAQGRSLRSAPSNKDNARKNPSNKRNAPPTELMIVAAPLIAGDDKDRLDEAARIVAGEPLGSDLYEGFWEPLVVSRRNISKMMSFVDQNVPNNFDGKLLLLEAVRQRALDPTTKHGVQRYDRRHNNLHWMLAYLGDEYDGLLAFWVLADLMIIKRGREPGYEGLQLVSDWAHGKHGPLRKELPVPTSAPDAVIELIRGVNYVTKHNAVHWDAVLAVIHDLVGAIPRQDPARKALAVMAANRVVSAPPFLFSTVFDKTRQTAPAHYAETGLAEDRARRNPDNGSSARPTTLMKVVAPLIAEDDRDRVEEAGLIMSGAPLESLPVGSFWDELIDARRNLAKAVAVVDRMPLGSLRPMQLVLEAIRLRALDPKADDDAANFARHTDLVPMVAYLTEIDALMAFWALVRMLSGIMPDSYVLQDIVDWAHGRLGARPNFPTSAQTTEPTKIEAIMYDAAARVIRENKVSEDTVAAVQRALLRSGTPAPALPRAAADAIVSMPPFLVSDAFSKTRRNVSTFVASRR